MCLNARHRLGVVASFGPFLLAVDCRCFENRTSSALRLTDPCLQTPHSTFAQTSRNN